MKSAAGLFYFKKIGNNEKYTIRLSRPLLQFRPFSDTINTLLHEMIHAFLFLKNERCRGHSEGFKKMMRFINEREGTSVTVYHNFVNAVQFHRKFAWRCTVRWILFMNIGAL